MESIGIPLARGLHLAATLLVFGTLLFTALIAPSALAFGGREAAAAERQLGRLALGGLLAATLAGLAWLALEAGRMADAASLGDALGAAPTVLFHTRFGAALQIRLVLLGITALAVTLGRGAGARWIAAVLAGGALLPQAWMGHPAAADSSLLLVASVLHVLAAGAWLGALPALFLLVRKTPGTGAAVAAEQFSRLGLPSVLILAGTAWIQSVQLIGDEGALAGTDYGRLAVGKLAVFALLLMLAAINRFRLTPALRGDRSERTGRHMLASIGAETALGLGVVLAASVLATLTPGAHEQAVWPFPLRPNKALLADKDVRNAFIEAALLLVIAVGLVGRAALFRRWRWPVLAAAVGLVYYANRVVDDAPFLDPMLIEAHPTSYYHSPTGVTATSIAQGAQLFAANCAACHGADGRGDGPLASHLPVRPANLTQEHVWGHSDGEMFWWLTSGIATRRYGQVMPAFGHALSDDDRWALIDFIHAHLAGATLATTRPWRLPVPAPAIQAVCGDTSSVVLEELRGKFVRVVATRPGAALAEKSDLPTIELARQQAEGPGCIASGEEAWTAYAIIAGVTPEQLAGTQFLIDPSGWLRMVLAPQASAEWSTPEGLATAVAAIAAHPLVAAAQHHHH